MNDTVKRLAALSPEKRALLVRQLQKQETSNGRPPLVPQPRTTGTFPLSFAQERQWFLQQWDGESSLYTISYAVRFDGPLDAALFQRAVDTLVARHEILRTTFAVINGSPAQIISEHDALPISHVDLSALPADEREQAAARLAAAETQRPFDLARGPLLRMLLIRLGPQQHVQVFTAHHIIFDGWSAGVIIRELGALLAALSSGNQVQLTPLPVQYADVAVWQRAWLQGDVLKQQVSYWERQLQGPLPVLLLPTDRPYPPVESARGARARRVLAPALVDALTQFTQAQNVTLFMTLLATWKTLLHRYTRQDDLLVGTPVAGRVQAQLEPLIGYFANTLVLRTDLGGDPSFTELLQRVRATTLAAYDHQDAPFEKVVEALQPERDLSHSPLFQVMFVLQNDAIKTLETADLAVAPFAFETGSAKFTLTLEASQRDGELALMLEYKTDLFDAPTIERMLDQYETLLHSAISRPALPISQLALLNTNERQRMIETWHQLDTGSSHPACIHELFAAQVARAPHAIAATFEQTQITYGELNARANQLAHQLRDLGIGPDSLVGQCVEPSIETLVGILGILKAGGAYVPIDPTYPRERIAFMLQDAQVAVLLTQQHLAERLPAHNAQIVLLDRAERLGAQPTTDPPTTTNPANLAYVIYTSGSTGKPKGVQVTHANVARLFSATDAWFGFGPQDVWTLFHSFAFDFSVWEIWGALLYGGRLVVVPYVTTRAPEAFHKLLRDERVTVLNQTPSAFRQLMLVDEAAQGASLALRYVIFGGEALNLKSLQPWFRRHGDSSPQLVNMYGITETTVHVTYRPLRYADTCDATGSLIGRPIPDLQLYILDQHREPVPLGVSGELFVGGAGVARGYLNRPELTVERFISHPFTNNPAARLYRTGDLARLLPNGDIEYLGRIDTQVKIRGFRIELGEIEAALTAHPAIREAVVMAREDVPGDQRLVAYLVVDQERAPTFGQLRSLLKRQLPEHMIPAAFVTLDAIPLTGNGKVNYRALPARESGPKLANEQPVVAATRPIEQVVTSIWAELLGLAHVGVNQNFFELGGHSLLATQVMTRLRDAFGVDLSLRDFFAGPTVAELVAGIEAARAVATETKAPPLVRIARSESLPLSFAQQRIWFLSQMQPDSAFYNVPVVFQFRGALRIDVLERCLSELMRRHEALRTTFHKSSAGSVGQRVNEAQPVSLPMLDLRDVPASERDAALWRLATAEIQRPFDLSHDPMLRGIVLRLAEAEHVLALTIHHIAFDEWSSGVLQHELTALYNAYAAGLPTPLADLPIQYVDYAVWQRIWLADVLDQQLGYWRDQLRPQGSRKLPTLDLPTDLPRPATLTNRGAHETMQIGPTLYAALNEFARAEEATLFMVLMAAWASLLGRYSAQDDILVGTPIANRSRSEIEAVIGFFANTLVIRNDLAGDPSFRALVRRTRETALSAYAHQDVPFDQLVSALQSDRDSSRSPLFQAMLVLQNAAQKPLTLPNLTIASLPVENATTKFELSLVLYDQGGVINGWLEYSTDLFTQTTMQRLLTHLLLLLERATAQPDQPLSHISLITDEEQQQLLFGWHEQTDDAYVLD